MSDVSNIPTHDTTRPESSTKQVRQASPQNVLTVLAISLVLVVAAFVAIYVW